MFWNEIILTAFRSLILHSEKLKPLNYYVLQNLTVFSTCGTMCEKALHCTDNPLGQCFKIATLSQAVVSVAC